MLLFLYLIKTLIPDYNLFLNISLIIQLFLSIISIILVYKIFLELFNKNYSLIGAFVYSFFPLNIYAVSQISSITLQMFLINIFILSFIKVFKNIKKINSIFFALSSALLILLRGEFFIFVLFSLFYLFLKIKNFWKILSISFLIILLISPYIYRNYTIFGVLTVTKSTGFNLLKGNNPLSKVEGVPLFGVAGSVVPEVRTSIEELKNKGPIVEHDLIKDQILLKQALQFIKENPSRYIKLYFQKFFSYLFIDINSNYPNYYSLYHVVPKILLSITAILGIILSISLRSSTSSSSTSKKF